MSVRHLVGAAAIVAATFLATRAVYSEESGTKGAAAAKPSEEEIWKMLEERAAPVEEHAKLASLAGTWDADVTCSCEESGEQKSKGTMSMEPVLGGRVLLSRFKGEIGGRPFEGLELHGFDKGKKEHWSIWCDSMGTSYMRSAGARDNAGDLAMKSDEFDCMGANYVSHMVTRAPDADHLVFEAVNSSAGLPEQKMTIRYARRK